MAPNRQPVRSRRPGRHLIEAAVLFWFLASPFAAAAEDADELYREGRFSEAEKAYARWDMDRPKDIRYRYNRGCAAYQSGDFQGAKAAFSSVLRRTEDEEIRFKSTYNLGNAAFREGDFESAIQYYKEALMLNPESRDARYNLELALREHEKQNRRADAAPKKEAQKDSAPSGDRRDASRTEKQGEKADKPPTDPQRQAEGGEPKQPEPQKDAEPEKQGTSGQRQPAENESPTDLSGALSPLQAMPEPKEPDPKAHSRASLDQKKAEALLDNLKEDRSRFLQFQIPRDKKAAPSGKDW
jgi:Ca-activated chloride channel family protein